MLPASFNLQDALSQPLIQPNLVLEIDGIDDLYSVGAVQSFIRVGDPGLYIGDSWEIGEKRTDPDNEQLITLEGTTTQINQQLNPDKGGASSVSTMQIALLDKREKITQLVTPGNRFEEILGRRARIYLGVVAENTSFPEDYSILFSGIIDDVTLGSNIVITVSHPDQKRRQDIFPIIETELDGAINNAVTTITLASVDDLLSESLPELETYVRIDDEIIRYTGVDVGLRQITGCTRAQFGTIAASHDDEASVATFYRLQDNAIDLALKVMLSGPDTYYLDGVPVSAFGVDADGNTLANALFFAGVNAYEKYGITAGDEITSVGATNGANNFTLREVTSVDVSDQGTVVVVSGSSLVTETDTAATISLRSQYNVLPDGMNMGGDQVDVEEFLLIRNRFFGQNAELDFYITETLNGKDFVDREILYPTNFYSIPRRGKVSIGAVSPPLSTGDLVELNRYSITRPDNIKIRRNLNKYFYNAVLYKYDFDAVETDKPLAGLLTINDDSRARFGVGTKSYRIDARGLRRSAETDSILSINGRRILERYANAAEFIQCETSLRYGARIDVGDAVLFGDVEMPLSDTKNGQRGFEPRLCEVVDRKVDIKNGVVSLTLVDTNYLTTGRYGTISPSSLIGPGSTASTIVITNSFGWDAPKRETDKWSQFVGQTIRVHSSDFSVDEETTLLSVSGSSTLVVSALSFTPSAGYVVNIPDYPNTTLSSDNRTYKNQFVFGAPKLDVVSGSSQTVFTVDTGQGAKVFVGSVVKVHKVDFSSQSAEVEVIDVTGDVITVDTSLGFTPDSTYIVSGVGFIDTGSFYRYL